MINIYFSNVITFAYLISFSGFTLVLIIYLFDPFFTFNLFDVH